MGKIHQRLEELGQERLLLESGSREERRLAEIAYAVMSDDRGDRAFAHPVMCLTTLPHRGRPLREVWIRTNGPATLTIQPTSDRHGNYFCVPYGSKARLILLFLQTEAVKSGCRQIELGQSMRAWLSRMGVAIGGKNLAEVRAQAKRIERSLITFSFEESSDIVSWQDTIVRGSFQSGSNSEIMAVELSDTFFKAIKDRPVPVSEAAIRALGEQSLAIDLYLWLAYRLHVLERPISLSWTALHSQFGGGVNLIKHWKPKFLRSFASALAAYPTAKAELSNHGVRLFPSPSPTGPGRLRSISA
jgi:hypothetical protein